MILHVGKILESEYGGSHPQDLHIEYFFLLLGTELVGKKDKIFTELNKKWDAGEEEWPELFFSTCKFLKIDQYETERQREERLNEIIRKPLLAKFADPKDPSNPPHIIVSRACKYKKQVIKHSLSTTEIESVLKTLSSEHLDYFYLMIKPRSGSSTTALPPSSILAPHIPGDWRAVEPVTAWPLTFIGHFPKLKPFEMERERESRLDREVRMPNIWEVYSARGLSSHKHLLVLC